MIGMKFYEIFQRLLDERGITTQVVADATGIPYQTLAGIAPKQKETLSFKWIPKLAKFFDVSMDYLITGNELPKTTPMALTDDEQNLITLWRQLPHDEQMKMIGRIEAVLEQCATEDDCHNLFQGA
jgi:transcriptional regulator with XRE-family HTH domain